ncbi:MAG: hypothetical protein QXI60_03335 [Thermofilaceae archaeon]
MRGLGRKIRQVLGEVAELFVDLWGWVYEHALQRAWRALIQAEAALVQAQLQSVQGIVDAAVRDPLPALGALLGLGRFIGLGSVLSIGAIVGAAYGVALDLSFADERERKSVAARLPFIPTLTKAEIEARLPYIPLEVDASTSASLKWIPEQVAAQNRAQLGWVQIMTDAQQEALLAWTVPQLQAQLDARRFVRPQPPDLLTLGALVLGGVLTLEEALAWTAFAGYPDRLLNFYVEAARRYPSPVELCDAYRRRIIDRDTFYKLMRRQGYSEDVADIIYRQQLYYPSPSDLITWQAREVYEPEAIERWGLAEELELLDRDPLYRGGLDDEQIRNYWIAHWDHPSFTQVAEMLVRDLLASPTARDQIRPGTEEWKRLREAEERLLYEWYRLVEIPPFWRDRLTRMIYQPLTRVDVRRAYDLGVLTEEDVLRNYLDLGYDLRNAQALTTFTKIERKLPDIVARYRNGWISSDRAYNEVLALVGDPEVAQRLWEEKVKKPVQPERVQRERDLTKTEIIKGVRKGVLTREQARSYLQYLGYDEQEAEYLLLINLDWAESPETPAEYLQGVLAWRAAVGLPSVAVPMQLHALERELAEVERALEEAKRQRAARSRIEELEARKALLSSHIQRAYAELARKLER